MYSAPLILDFDRSVRPLGSGEARCDLAAWQEAVRFGCSRRVYTALECLLLERLREPHHGVFLGSGDFHHLSFFLLKEAARRHQLLPCSLDVIVLDNHPDNMRYPFGIHCGSWVSHAAQLPFVRTVHVVGITSNDIAAAHAWENRLTSLWKRKLVYWSVGVRADWLSCLGRGGQAHTFASADALVKELEHTIRQADRLYLSIDKDVLSPETVHTDWDQGVFTLEHVQDIARLCSRGSAEQHPRLVGFDVTGECSSYTFQSLFKRFLTRLDGRAAAPDHETLAAAQEGHRRVNEKLLSCLQKGA